MTRKSRIISQSVFLLLFLVTFFVLLKVPHVYALPAAWFLRLNPLVGLLTAIASHTILLPLFILGAVIALATVVFGRFFCGALCPMGTIIDFCDRYIFAKIRLKGYCPPSGARKLKYILLFSLLTMAMFGALLPMFMDPILLLTRIFTLVINPMFCIITDESRAFLAPVLRMTGNDNLALTTIKVPLFFGIAGTLGLFLFVILGSLFDRRFWCQYICPSGALFALLSRFALYRRRVDQSKCSTCKICASACPTHAISADCISTSVAECILCGRCNARKKSCTSFGFAPISRAQTHGADIQRRHIFTGILGGLFLIPVLRANASIRTDNFGQAIRPPGAIPEKEFLAKCISCGACMKVCPTNALQPCLMDEGFQRIYTPRIVARIGGCEEKCSACGYACPTGAIRKLPYEQKQFVKIGTAVIDRHRCLAWEQNKECLVCDEVCPYNAITFRMVETTTGPFKVPVIDEELCIGCGMCEQHCPIIDRAAIQVFRFGEVRRSTGTYVTEQQKLSILKKRLASDSNFNTTLSISPTLPASTETASSGHSIENNAPPTADNSSSGLPPGFSE